MAPFLMGLTTFLMIWQREAPFTLHTSLWICALWTLQDLSRQDFKTRHVPINTTFMSAILWTSLIHIHEISLMAWLMATCLIVLPYVRPTRPLMAPVDGFMLALLLLTLPDENIPLFLMGTGGGMMLLMRATQEEKAPLFTCAWAGYLLSLLIL